MDHEHVVLTQRSPVKIILKACIHGWIRVIHCSSPQLTAAHADHEIIMADYLKTATEKVKSIASAAGEKARAIGESLSKIATGNDGALSNAKGAAHRRQQQVEDAAGVATKMANGGRVRPQRG